MVQRDQNACHPPRGDREPTCVQEILPCSSFLIVQSNWLDVTFQSSRFNLAVDFPKSLRNGCRDNSVTAEG